MSARVIESDRTQPWLIIGDHHVWTLQADAQLYVYDDPAVWVGKGARNNTINIYGDIINAGTDGFGLAVMGNHNHFLIGRQASISGAVGISGPGTHAEVVNRGSINALAYGLFFNGPTDIENAGTIAAAVAILAEKGSTITNGVDGRIIGYDIGVVLDAGNNRVVNDGVIAGPSFSLVNDGDAATIVNRGRMDGDVALGTGNDVLDTRAGKIRGNVYGGTGDDTFLLSDVKLDILEDDGEGIDTIRATIDYSLDAHIERLVLLGKDDLAGTGNVAANYLQGNAGGNSLRGLQGGDILRGGAGADRLTGGGGADTFLFIKGDQTEIIRDYDDLIDTLQILDTRFSGFAGLSKHFETHGSDTWIVLGGDDRIILKGIDAAVLDKNDFEFNA